MGGRKSLVVAACLIMVAWVHAEPTAGTAPYDASADAQADLDAARAQAQADGRYLMVLFGANWCPDCRAFDAALRDSDVAPMVETRFVVSKVDVGNWDRNLDIVEAWGDPIAGGIPAVVVTTPAGYTFYTSKAGALARARHMDQGALVEFFEQVLALGEDAMARSSAVDSEGEMYSE